MVLNLSLRGSRGIYLYEIIVSDLNFFLMKMIINIFSRTWCLRDLFKECAYFVEVYLY